MSYGRIRLLTTLVACLTVTHVRAEVAVIEDAEGQQGLTIFRMTVTPAAESVPALKHRLRLPLHLRKPGNAATYYLRSFGEGGAPGRLWRRLVERHGEEIHSWYSNEIPIEELPLEQVREVARAFDSEHYKSASRCRRCDWGLAEEDLQGLEAISFLLPDAQESRAISRGLVLLTRLAIAERRFDDAVEYMRMNYQLGQDFSKQRFLVCSLIGLAEVNMTNASMIDFIGAQGSPNMYWALSELPRPLINVREALNLDMSLGLRMFPALLDAETREHAPEEWKRLVVTTVNDLRSADSLLDSRLPKNEILAKFGVAGMSLAIYPSAKQRLIAAGDDPQAVEAMPVTQVLLIDTAREYQKLADEQEKWFFVSYQDMRRVNFDQFQLADGFGPMLADLLLPAVQAVKTAQMRTHWQTNAIRTIEALRMHAAETGEFPESLDDVNVAPVPKNPITEAHYTYRRDGKKVVLELPFADGMPGTAWRFEITLAD